MIKIRLEKWEKAIVMQVLEMDESLRGMDIIYDNGEFSIASEISPELDCLQGYVYVRGNDETCDFEVKYTVFSNNEKRDECYNKIVKLFNDYNNIDKINILKSHADPKSILKK